MNQFYLKFNLETLEQSYKSFQLRYSCDEYDVLNFNKKEFTCLRIQNDQQYCCRKLKKGTINSQRFNQLRKIKLYNILPAFDLYKDSESLVAQDFDKFALYNNLEGLTDGQKFYLSAILSITMQELCFRGFPMILTERNVIILENHICVQQIDFSFDREVTIEESFESFKKIMINLFGEFNEINYEDSTNYLLQKNDVYLGPSENMPFVELLDQIFEFSNVITLSTAQSNSYVYEFDTPEFMKTIPTIQSRTVMKSLKLDLYEADQEYLLTTSQRELEIMENFKKYEPLVSCYAYFRVQKQLFLFMERYPQVLSNMLNEINDERFCIDLCCQLAVALKHLHRHSIIHRDLKPGNLFLSNEELDRAQLYIADFDRSKSSQWLTKSIEMSQRIDSGSIKQPDVSTANSVLGATPTYDPPEAGTTNYDIRADIWQVGMIFFQIANRGEYPVEMTSLNFTHDQYQKWFTKERIQEKLSKYNVSQELIDIIAQCLSYRKEDRPSADQLTELLKKSFEEYVVLNEDDTMLSTHNLSLMGRFSQLVIKTKTMKFLNSSEL